ncbi:class I SAM-dependent methyltransferase [Halorhabdus sp. CUG00001]|uniref:class I SAM-dependent methyltransferase n=1 Tax=Halorhabdus sp. CUG00001 TaxID=2600297 RepID=UPI00131C279E|nr:class I SAM-dependent methyltransferase [Halorhabdus sp. CUG00001]
MTGRDGDWNPDANRRQWAEREGAFSPEYYAEIGPNEVSETLVDALSYYATADARILELGCSSGRHLEALRQAGYENLTGVDLNADALDVMAEYFPRTAETGTFHIGAIEDLLPEFETGAFEVVYSVETLQHVHPEETAVFEEVLRVTDDLLLTAENEGNAPDRGRSGAEVSAVHDEFPLYHRDWKAVFTDLGAVQLFCEPTNRDTIRAFRVL